MASIQQKGAAWYGQFVYRQRRTMAIGKTSEGGATEPILTAGWRPILSTIAKCI
jgi:hypothetical protein